VGFLCLRDLVLKVIVLEDTYHVLIGCFNIIKMEASFIDNGLNFCLDYLVHLVEALFGFHSDGPDR
jgi:hypothetical protein